MQEGRGEERGWADVGVEGAEAGEDGARVGG